MKNYWVVSPNVRNNEATVGAWRRASVLGRTAFMGWKPGDHEIGNRFVEKIEPGDLILIARRHRFEPEIVGFGIARGKATEILEGVITPQTFGSARRLSPFIPMSRAPKGVPVIHVLRHTSALAQLHPDTSDSHARVCRWMDGLLALSHANSRKAAKAEILGQDSTKVQLVDLPEHHQLDYIFRSREQLRKAKKDEARLLSSYRSWLKGQGRVLVAAKHGKLQCDAFEKARCNLIEAKSSTRREYIRMAVGQLLDYSFQIQKKYGTLHMAILLPQEPDSHLVNWLSALNVSLVWRRHDAFLDNSNGQFM